MLIKPSGTTACIVTVCYALIEVELFTVQLRVLLSLLPPKCLHANKSSQLSDQRGNQETSYQQSSVSLASPEFPTAVSQTVKPGPARASPPRPAPAVSTQAAPPQPRRFATRVRLLKPLQSAHPVPDRGPRKKAPTAHTFDYTTRSWPPTSAE